MIGDAVAEARHATAKSLGLRSGAGAHVPRQQHPRRRPGDPVLRRDRARLRPAPPEPDGITLNQWAARELNAKPGDQVTLDYYVWKSDGRLHTDTAQFRLAQIVPHRRRGGRPRLRARLSRASRNPTACTIGIRRFRSISSASGRSTSSTGSNIAPRRRLSSRWRAASSFGGRASAG